MNLLNVLLDQSELLLVALDCETALVADCNEAQCRAAGRTREELVGQPVRDVHVSFPLRTGEQWRYFVGRVEAQPGLTVDTQYRRTDGSFYPVQIKCFPQEWAGRRYILVVASRAAGGPVLQSHFEREARWQKALFQMASHPAVSGGRFEEAACFIAASGRAVFPANLCTIWRMAGPTVQFVADHVGLARPGLDQPIQLAEYPWLEAALNTGRCTDLYDCCQTAEERAKAGALAAAYGAKAVLCAPVRTGGVTWGVVTVASESERQWQPDEVGFAAEIADQVAQAVSSADRRRGEQELRLSQERHRNFIEMSAEAVWRIEFTEPVPLDLPVEEQVAAVIGRGFVADCNQAFPRFLRRERREEFLGMPLRQLLAPIDPVRLLETRQMVEAGYRIVDLETRHLVKGEELWALGNITGVFENGKLVQLWGATRDITERKRAGQLLVKSEQRYRAFVANSSEAIFRVEYPEPIPLDLPLDEIVQRTWDTGILAECNVALAKMRGYQRPEELVGRLSIEFRTRSQEEWRQDIEFLERGCRITDMERPTRRADGTLAWFNYSVLGVVENGRLARVWGRVADITARRGLEEELRALSARRASTLEQERSRIAREIHDELGQQLTALKFEAAAWERGARQPGRGELTHSIDEAIQTVRRIASDLRPAILDHFGLVPAMEWLANEVSRRTGLECDCDLEVGLEVEKALATTVFRIFQEALNNAAKHSEAKLVQVRLHTRAGRLELSVQDDGKGVGPGGPEQPSGSLGLIGMRERAKEAGGAVAITGVPGQGTRVTAWFPLAETEARLEWHV